LQLLQPAFPRYRERMAIAEPGVSSATMTGQLGLYELRAGDVLAGRFRIESMLGIGGMGVVYRAFDQSLDLSVAIKLLRPELARKPEAFERFRQELLLARQVSSPHVVRIHDIAQHNGRWFISMDFIDGESLEKRMDLAGKLPVDETIAITHDLLDGLTAAQQRGVVHRDLKPANILLDARGTAYITDFGVARSLGATGATGSGVIVGTPDYLSPEQARGDSVDMRSDLYTIGLIVYEMLAGVLPFNAGTPAETVMQRIVRPPPSLAKARPDLPHWLHLFVDRLLKLNPAHRFASAQEALRALEAKRVPRQPIDRRLLLGGVLVITALAGAANWVYRYPTQTEPKAAVIAPATPQLALMPIHTTDDPDLRAVARALDEHLYAWLRSDQDLAVVPGRRVQQATARAAADANAETLRRLLPDIAAAVSANRMLHGDLTRDAQSWVLILSAGAPAPAELTVRGADAAALFAAYKKQVPPFLASAGFHAGSIPQLSDSALAAYGRALLDLDAQRAEAATKELDGVAVQESEGALLAAARLRATETAGQDAPAQNERDIITKQFAQDATPGGLELYAHALDGTDDDKAARTLARAMHDYPHDAALVLANAESLRASGDGTQAIKILKSYVARNPDDARAWFMLGRAAIEQSDARAAVEDYLLHAQTLNTLARDSAAEAETRNALGIGYERLGQLAASADEYERAVAIRDKIGDDKGMAKTLRNLAIVQAEQGRRSDAERTLTRAKSLLEKLGDRASVALLYNDRGVVAEEGGDFAEALSFYRQAYAIRQQLDDPVAVAESLNNIGYASYRMGDYDNATVYWTQALAQYQKLDDRAGILHIQQNTALLQIARGQFAAARKALTDSRSYAQEHQLPEEAAVADVSLAELSLVEGSYTSALESAEQAAKVFARRADQRGLAEAALLRARIAIALGQAEEAGKLLAAIDRQHLNQEQLAEFQLASAQQAALSGNRKLQAAQLDAAAEAAGKAHSGALAIRIDMQRVQLAMTTHDDVRATKLLTEVRKQNTRLNEVPLRLEWLELEMAMAVRGGNAADAATRYREALALLKNSGRFATAGTLHTLGAAALTGHATDIAAAQSAADAARERILADAPENARTALATELARQLRESMETDHGR
jgi:eukaryotic-like serine/threonine-protein kinase